MIIIKEKKWQNQLMGVIKKKSAILQQSYLLELTKKAFYWFNKQKYYLGLNFGIF